MKLLTVVFAVFVIVAAPSGQEPRFDVASVKVSPRTSIEAGGGSRTIRPGEIQITAGALRRILPMAFDVPSQLVTVKFDFSRIGRTLLTETWFDIHAKGNPAQSVTAMMQTLLKERFGLTWHRETRQVAVYAMTVKQRGALGPWLKPSQANCRDLAAAPRLNPTLVSAPKDCHGTAELRQGNPRHRSAGTTGDLAVWLQAFSNLPIIDATGLKGNYAWDFAMPWMVRSGQELAAVLRDAAEDQLGLRLTRTMGPWEVIVIDDIRMPTPN